MNFTNATEADQSLSVDEPFKVKKFQDGRQIVFDVTSLDQLCTCPKLYKLGTLEGYRPKKEAPPSLWGLAVHYGLEILARARLDGLSLEDATKASVIKTIERYGGKLAPTGDEHGRDLHGLLRCLIWYAQDHYHDNLQTAAMPDGSPALEQRFEVEIPNTKWRLAGRIDRVAWLDGKLYLVDYKTTKSALSNFYFDKYSTSNQVFAYIWALREVLGLPIAGFIIDAIQTQMHNTRFGRQLFQISPAQIQVWQRQLYYWLEQAEKYFQLNYYPENFASCGNMGGCRFLPVCSRETALQQTWLDADYIKRGW